MNVIREKRLSAGLKQNEVCKLLEVKPSTVSMWETGKSFPRIDTLKKLATVLRCTPNDLLDIKEAV